MTDETKDSDKKPTFKRDESGEWFNNYTVCEGIPFGDIRSKVMLEFLDSLIERAINQRRLAVKKLEDSKKDSDDNEPDIKVLEEYWKENDQYIIQAYKDLIKIEHRLVDWQDELDQIGHDVTYGNPRYQ
jgi:hypothetical protein